MQEGREPSMEEILASIKKVIAEEKDLRVAAPPSAGNSGDDDERADEGVLELNEPLNPVDLGPPLVESSAADAGRTAFDQLKTVAANAPPPPGNPLEDMVRDMLRPILKQWLDDHLPQIIDEHVKREISRITGRPL